jgi:hypothetical protein
MFPTFREGDMLTIAALGSEGPQTGEVVAFERGGELFAHRVVETGEGWVVTRGDGNARDDAAVGLEQIVGRVVRHGRGAQVNQGAAPGTGIASTLRRVRGRLAIWRRIVGRPGAERAGAPADARSALAQLPGLLLPSGVRSLVAGGLVWRASNSERVAEEVSNQVHVVLRGRDTARAAATLARAGWRLEPLGWCGFDAPLDIGARIRFRWFVGLPLVPAGGLRAVMQDAEACLLASSAGGRERRVALATPGRDALPCLLGALVVRDAMAGALDEGGFRNLEHTMAQASSERAVWCRARELGAENLLGTAMALGGQMSRCPEAIKPLALRARDRIREGCADSLRGRRRLAAGLGFELTVGNTGRKVAAAVMWPEARW